MPRIVIIWEPNLLFDDISYVASGRVAACLLQLISERRRMGLPS